MGKKCHDPGSNRGHLDLQSNALPTELFRRPAVGSNEATGSLDTVAFCLLRRSNSNLDRLNNHLFFSFYLLNIQFIHPFTAILDPDPEEKSRRKDK